jgi:hypothetical protein
MSTRAGEITTLDRDDAGTPAPSVAHARLRSPRQRRGLLVSLLIHLTILLCLLNVGPSGRSPTPSSGDTVFATLIVALPQAPSAPNPIDAPPTEEIAPAVEPPPLPEGPRVAPAPATETTLPATADVAAEPPATEPPAAAAAPTPTDPALAAGIAPADIEVDVAADEQREAALAGAAAAADNANDTPSTALTSDEQQMLQRRLASWTGQFTADDPAPTFDWRADGQRYTAVLKPVPATDAMGMEQLAVEITTERGGERLVTEMRMARIAFSSFAQFVDHWDSGVQLHDDVIDGRFHSNSEFRVARQSGVEPTFRGKVTLAARDIGTDAVGWLNRRAMFPEGLETSVRRIPLPEQTTTLGTLDDAEHVQRFDVSSAITFYADGSYGWRPLDGGAPERRRKLGSEQAYLVGGDKVHFELEGVVDGTVLVYSQESIVITGDLRYAHDPRGAGADDYLGLVAEGTIEIAKPEVTGPGDLEVQASLYARNRFVVREFRSKRSGTLKLYGSLAAGSLTATEPRFATKIEYDARLETIRPPGFPLSDRYELESWNGQWRSAPR